jgi:hypothetical protein
LKCDCGGESFFKFGPFDDREDPVVFLDGVTSDMPGLRWIYTCSSCGDQLRVYLASKMWEKPAPSVREAGR